MQSLPVRLFHASLSGLLLGTLFSLGVFFLLQKIHATASLGNFRGNWSNHVSPESNGAVIVNSQTSDDEDGDGIPNKWEADNSHSPNEPGDAGYDFDFDGLTAKQEYNLYLLTNGAFGKPLGTYDCSDIVLPLDYKLTSSGVPVISAVNIVETAKNGFVLVKITGVRIGATSSSSSFYTYNPKTDQWALVRPPSNVPGSVLLTPTDINSKGQVVGSYRVGNTNIGFVWTPNPLVPSVGESTQFFVNPSTSSPMPAIPKRIGDTGYLIYTLSSPSGTPKAADPQRRAIDPIRDPWTTPEYIDVNDYGEFVGTIYNPMTWQINTFLAMPDGPFTLSVMSQNDLSQGGASHSGADYSAIEWNEVQCYHIDGWEVFPGDVSTYPFGEVIDSEGNVIDPDTFPVYQYGAIGSSAPYFRRGWGSDEVWWSWDQSTWEFLYSSESPSAAINDWGEFAGLYSFTQLSQVDGGDYSSLDSKGSFFFDGAYHLLAGVDSIQDISNDPQILYNIQSYDLSNNFSLWSDNVFCPVSKLRSAGLPQPLDVRLCDNGVMIVRNTVKTLQIMIPRDDADGDGMPDDWEKSYGLEPAVNDANGDADGDGTNNLGEFLLRSDPNAAPVLDSDENEIDLRPGIDTDGDGIPNVWEWNNGLNYNDASDAPLDYDRDGYTNLQEFRLNTDPRGAPSYRMRALGPFPGAYSARLSSATLGDGSLPDSSGTYQSGNILESVHFWATPAGYFGRNRPATWSLSRAQDTGDFSMAAGNAPSSPTLLATSTSGATLWRVNGSTTQFLFWPSATATHVTLSGSVATNNIRLLSDVRISPSGTYVAATRQSASSSNSTDLILWKMPAFTSDIDSRPISLPLPPGATLSGGLQVNDFGRVLGNCRLPSGQMVPVLWKISSTGLGVTLSTLPSFSVSADATATGISNQALPWVCGNATLANGQKRSVVWSSAETLIEIPSLPASGASSATLIARNGTVAGVSEVLVEGAIMHQVFIASLHAASSTWKLQPQGEPLVNPPLLLSVNDHGEILGSTAEPGPAAPLIPTIWRNGLSHPIADCIANTTSATLESSTQLSPHGTLLATVWKDGEEITVLLVPDRDTDSDGLPDDYENRHAFNAFVKNSPGRDTDSDGLSDLDEYRNGTDPHNPDTDRDGMNDGWEVSWGLLPMDPSDAALDPDGDRVPNFRESSIGTVPTGIYKVLPWAPETPVENPELIAADDAGNLIVADLHQESRSTPDGYTEEEGWKNIYLYPAGGNARVALPSSTWLHRSSTFDYYYDDLSSGKIPEYALDPVTGMANGWLRDYEIHNTEYDFYYSDQTFLIPNAATNLAPLAWLPWQTIEAALRQHPDAALAEGAVLDIWPQAVSSSGTRRIHTSNYPTWKSFVLDQHGNYQYTLPEGLSFSLINDHGEAAVLTSRHIPAVSDQPAFTQWEIQTISHGGDLFNHPLVGFENTFGSSLRLLRLSNDRKLLFSFTERSEQLNSVTHYYLLDLASGAVSRLRRPALGAETIISLSTSNSRLLGSGPKPFQITPDGTCIRLDALRIKNDTADKVEPLGDIYLHPLTPHHITSDGRITLTTKNPEGQQVILQIVPHNDTDDDGLPDDWEKANDLDGPGDKDGDGLTNAEEFVHGTNSFERDSDGDGMSDGDEIRSGLNALNRDQDGQGQTDGYEDWDNDGYTNREEVMCRTDPNDPTRYPDGSPEHADPDGPGGLSPILSIRNYRFELQELESVRRAVFSKPGYRGFVDGALSGGNPPPPSDAELEFAANNRPNFYLNMETVEGVDEAKEWNLSKDEYDDLYKETAASSNSTKGVRVTAEKTIKVDGVYTSDYAESGSATYSFSDTYINFPGAGTVSDSNTYSFPNSFFRDFCKLGDSPEKIVSDSVKRTVYSDNWIEAKRLGTEVGHINNSKTITLSEIYSDGDLIADLNDELASTVWENPGQAYGVSSSFLWDHPYTGQLPLEHVWAEYSESKYRVVSTEPSIPAGATVKFIWKEVFLPQEGEGGEFRAEWFDEGGVKITSGPNAGQFQTSDRHLKHPETPGTVIPGSNNNGIDAPEEMACLNPGETSLISRELTNASGNTKVIESVQRGEPIRFQVDLADQKNNPRLTASDVSMVTLWERKKDGEWVNHQLPYNIPAEQAAGVLSDPGSYVLQGKKPGTVTLQITANGVVRDEEEVQFRRMDVDVDSNNSGALETSPEEEKVESDPREPGKILLDSSSSESDENGIPLHPEKLAGLKIQTANLKAGKGVSLSYPDKVLRVWKARPGQALTQADLITPNRSYTPSELGLAEGSTAEFSIQSLNTATGLFNLDVTSGVASDQILINLVKLKTRAPVIPNEEGNTTYSYQPVSSVARSIPLPGVEITKKEIVDGEITLSAKIYDVLSDVADGEKSFSPKLWINSREEVPTIGDKPGIFRLKDHIYKLYPGRNEITVAVENKLGGRGWETIVVEGDPEQGYEIVEGGARLPVNPTYPLCFEIQRGYEDHSGSDSIKLAFGGQAKIVKSDAETHDFPANWFRSKPFLSILKPASATSNQVAALPVAKPIFVSELQDDLVIGFEGFKWTVPVSLNIHQSGIELHSPKSLEIQETDSLTTDIQLKARGLGDAPAIKVGLTTYMGDEAERDVSNLFTTSYQSAYEELAEEEKKNLLTVTVTGLELKEGYNHLNLAFSNNAPLLYSGSYQCFRFPAPSKDGVRVFSANRMKDVVMDGVTARPQDIWYPVEAEANLSDFADALAASGCWVVGMTDLKGCFDESPLKRSFLLRAPPGCTFHAYDQLYAAQGRTQRSQTFETEGDHGASLADELDRIQTDEDLPSSARSALGLEIANTYQLHNGFEDFVRKNHQAYIDPGNGVLQPNSWTMRGSSLPNHAESNPTPWTVTNTLSASTRATSASGKVKIDTTAENSAYYATTSSTAPWNLTGARAISLRFKLLEHDTSNGPNGAFQLAAGDGSRTWSIQVSPSQIKVQGVTITLPVSQFPNGLIDGRFHTLQINFSGSGSDAVICIDGEVLTTTATAQSGALNGIAFGDPGEGISGEFETETLGFENSELRYQYGIHGADEYADSDELGGCNNVLLYLRSKGQTYANSAIASWVNLLDQNVNEWLLGKYTGQDKLNGKQDLYVYAGSDVWLGSIVDIEETDVDYSGIPYFSKRSKTSRCLNLDLEETKFFSSDQTRNEMQLAGLLMAWVYQEEEYQEWLAEKNGSGVGIDGLLIHKKHCLENIAKCAKHVEATISVGGEIVASMTNEYVDYAITINAVRQGDYMAMVGFIPIVPSSTARAIKFIDKIDGSVIEGLDRMIAKFPDFPSQKVLGHTDANGIVRDIDVRNLFADHTDTVAVDKMRRLASNQKMSAFGPGSRGGHELLSTFSNQAVICYRTKEPTKAYRLFDGGSGGRKESNFLLLEPPVTKAQAEADYALGAGGSPFQPNYDSWIEIEIPAGSYVFTGVAGKMDGKYVGGGRQVWIEDDVVNGAGIDWNNAVVNDLPPG
jgi:hypothetical protein